MTQPEMKLPEVKFNKNGYEIRADILALAKDHINNEFQVKFAGWQITAEKDEKTGQLVSTVQVPEYPGVDKVLEAAEKFYSFVNTGVKK